MTEQTERDRKIEVVARRIVIEHDGDPDDGRLGFPAWRIPWILEQAAKEIDEQIAGDAPGETK